MSPNRILITLSLVVFCTGICWGRGSRTPEHRVLSEMALDFYDQRAWVPYYPSEHEITVTLKTLNDHEHKFTYRVEPYLLKRMVFSPKAVRQYIRRAKRDYCKKHIRYNPRFQGPDAYKIIPGLRVTEVKARLGSHTRTKVNFR